VCTFLLNLDVGLIVTISADKVVSEDIGAQELYEIQQRLLSEYQVPAGELKMDTVYLTKGTLDVDVAGLSNDEALDDLQKALADILDVPQEAVTLTVENGVVNYEIARDTYDDAVSSQNILSQNNIADLINAATESVSVSNVSNELDIRAEVTITVDVDESTLSESDIEAMEATVADFFESYNYENTNISSN